MQRGCRFRVKPGNPLIEQMFSASAGSGHTHTLAASKLATAT
jgi:hypothetical protein